MSRCFKPEKYLKLHPCSDVTVGGEAAHQVSFHWLAALQSLPCQQISNQQLGRTDGARAIHTKRVSILHYPQTPPHLPETRTLMRFVFQIIETGF